MRSTGIWLFLGALVLACTAAPAPAGQDPFPRPPALERDVQFWIRVYTEVNTNSGFLHDEYNLSVVYDTLHFSSESSRERERLIEAARNRYIAALKRIAGASGPLSPDDQRVRDLWGSEGTPVRLLEATNHIRFQLGQADRFREGLIRSGRWQAHIAETLANLGLPPELAVLPHVESSFNPAAYSKVGAAGLWQFMRSTGRRYMRIDSTVDDRLDPFHATEAAAQLLAYNYRLLGTWPLALTAYNHGAAGMRRAKEQLGTDDIAEIVRHYSSPSFGFASRNFYVSFLAALEIDRDPEKYFGPMKEAPEAQFRELTLPVRASIPTLERVLKIDRDTLHQLNPALRPGCWRGQRPVPRGYKLRLPADSDPWTPELLVARLGPGELRAAQAEPVRHRVLAGETLQSIAAQYGVPADQLARFNRVKLTTRLRTGRSLRVPTAPGAAQTLKVAQNTPAPADTRTGAVTVTRVAAADTMSGTATAGAPPGAGPPGAGSAVVAMAARAASAAVRSDGAAGARADGFAAAAASVPSEPNPLTADLGPPAGVKAGPELADTYTVQRGESLAEVASKVGVPESTLLRINGMPNPDYVFEGQQLATQPPAPGAEDGGRVPVQLAERESDEDAVAEAAVVKPARRAEPVSAEQEEALGPALGPAALETTAGADPTDYTIAKDDTIVVAAAETIGHYADWLGMPAARLRTLNHMRHNRPVVMGHRFRLDFARTSHEEFESKRREYHRTLEASYFAAHRITGTEVYIARRGDSLWNVTQRYEDMPIWLLQQYNPDVDFGEMRPGTQIVVPRVEDVSTSGG